MKKAKHLVVDAGALIKNAPIFELAENVYTLPEIVKEIKDKQTRERLQSLPFEFKFRELPPEIIKIVTEFSKKTGDYASLSANDIKIIALTYLLEKEFVGTHHIKIEPSSKVNSFKAPPDFCKPIAGFYNPKSSKGVSFSKDDKTSQNNTNEEQKAILSDDTQITDIEDKLSHVERSGSGSESKEKNEGLDVSAVMESSEKEDDGSSSGEGEGSQEEEEEEDGWITPNNFKDVKKQMEALTLEDTSVVVACITTDFSMQNVLMQMGLHVVSTEGMLIKQCRTFVLRCFACFSITTVMTKQFCPSCGNKTLKKVAFSIAEDGSRILHLNFRRPINIRGTRYSLPLPKGGKHAENPILCEDQRIPQNRPPKSALQKVNALDPDYEARNSPFAINDVYSRAANLGIRVNRRPRNPNERRKNTRK